MPLGSSSSTASTVGAAPQPPTAHLTTCPPLAFGPASIPHPFPVHPGIGITSVVMYPELAQYTFVPSVTIKVGSIWLEARTVGFPLQPPIAHIITCPPLKSVQ